MTHLIPTDKNQITSREIAKVTGKQHAHLMRDIRAMEAAWEKVNQSRFGLVDYIDAKGEKRPMFSLTKTECLYIATKFNDEARAKLILRWEELEKVPALTNNEILLQVLQGNIAAEKKQVELEGRIEAIESLPKINGTIQQFAIIGHCSNLRKHITLVQAATYGRACSKLCRELGFVMGSIPDPRFGRVKTYPLEVLEQVIGKE